MNRKLLLSLLFAPAGIAPLSAQDLIVKTDSTRVEARVLEISPEQIRYKRFSNPDGPTYVLPVGTVEYIRYINGEIDRFRPESAAKPQSEAAEASRQDPNKPQTLPANPPIPVMPAPKQARTLVDVAAETEAAAAADTPPQDANKPQTLPANPPRYVMPVPQQQAPAEPAAQNTVMRRYDVGDYYEENGLRGIVFQTNEEKTHGLIVSMDEIYLPWSSFDKSDARSVGATHADDGRVNTETVAAYIAANGGSWEDFPAFKWCLDQGEGWYLPAINEVLNLGNSFNGGGRMKYDRQARNRFNDNLKNHGGKRLNRLAYHYSSTERDAKTACTSHMDLEPPFVVDIPKHTKFLVRAVHRF